MRCRICSFWPFALQALPYADIGDATNGLVLRRPSFDKLTMRGASKGGGQGSATSADGPKLLGPCLEPGGFSNFRACGPSFEARLRRAPQDEAVGGGNQMSA